MAKVSKRIIGPVQLGAAAATLYTTPAATKTIVRRIHLSNPTGGPVGVTLSFGADAAGTRLYSSYAIPAADVYDIYGPFTLEAAEIIQGFASVAASVTITVDAEENTP